MLTDFTLFIEFGYKRLAFNVIYVTMPDLYIHCVNYFVLGFGLQGGEQP